MTQLGRHLLATACVTGWLLGGCNLMTGADGLEIDPDWSGAQPSYGSDPGSSTWVAADRLTVDQVAVYQGVKRPLMQAGQDATTNVPLIADRNGLLRIFYTVHPGFNQQPVTALLAIGDEPPRAQLVTVAGSSTDEELGSTINFELPAELLARSTDYRVDLLQPRTMASGSNSDAGYPAHSGHAPLELEEPGGPLRIVLVPIAYAADGSNRLPDLSEGQLARYREALLGAYPISVLDLRVGDALGWDVPLASAGNGWEELLDALTVYRNERAASDEYYFGLVAPAETITDFCAQGCVSGLSTIVGTDDVFARAAIGLGFAGEEAVHGVLHETGHMHGRKHAPCSHGEMPDGLDPSFPYPAGGIGPSGFDGQTWTFKRASSNADLMGYCAPAWVSDYTFAALFDRIRAVSLASADPTSLAEPNGRPWELVSVHGDGQSRWLGSVEPPTRPSGAPTEIETLVAGHWITTTGRLLERSAGGGGLLSFERQSEPVEAVRLLLDGQRLTAMRHGLDRVTLRPRPAPLPARLPREAQSRQR